MRGAGSYFSKRAFERENLSKADRNAFSKLVNLLVNAALEKHHGSFLGSIAQNLQEAIDLNAAKAHRPEPVDVAALRKKLGMPQMELAAKFCISGALDTR